MDHFICWPPRPSAYHQLPTPSPITKRTYHPERPSKAPFQAKLTNTRLVLTVSGVAAGVLLDSTQGCRAVRDEMCDRMGRKQQHSQCRLIGTNGGPCPTRLQLATPVDDARRPAAKRRAAKVWQLTVQFSIPVTTEQYQQQLIAESARYQLNYLVLQRLITNAVAKHNASLLELYNRARDLSETEPGQRHRFPAVLDSRSPLFGLNREQVSTLSVAIIASILIL
jgi:hypothetical protein